MQASSAVWCDILRGHLPQSAPCSQYTRATKPLCGCDSVPQRGSQALSVCAVLGLLPTLLLALALLTGSCGGATHQLHQHDDQKRRRHKSADEDALVIKVRLLGKRLPVLPQIGVDALSIVHNSSCSRSQNCRTEAQSLGLNFLAITRHVHRSAQLL